MARLKPATNRRQIPRPALWRISLVQGLAWCGALALALVFWPEHLPALAWAGALALSAQGFWIWRSLRGFGDPASTRYLAGATAGLVGKWAIILVGLVLLWRHQPDLSIAVTVVTVFTLNTLAALAAPISISHPRSGADNR